MGFVCVRVCVCHFNDSVTYVIIYVIIERFTTPTVSSSSMVNIHSSTSLRDIVVVYINSST